MADGALVNRGWRSVDGQPVPYLTWLRDAKNVGSPYAADREPYPKSKHAFCRFVIRNGGRTAQTLAHVDAGELLESTVEGAADLTSLLERLPHGHYFCKPNYGGQGYGAAQLDVSPGGWNLDGEPRSLAEIVEFLSADDYLIQESLTPLQHADLNRYNGRVLNTLRLTIFDEPGGPVAVAGFLRLANANRSVDNWSVGGVAIPLRLEEGIAADYGILKKGFVSTALHDRSGLRFGGMGIPYLDEAIAMTCRLHARLAVKTLGWDVALLRDGPCMIETNDFWGLYMHARTVPGFLSRFLEYHLPDEPEAVAQFELEGDFTNRPRVRLWLSNIAGRALASGRADYLSDERFAFTLAGSKRGLSSALNFTKKYASLFKLRRLRTTRSAAVLDRGLDVRAIVAGAVPAQDDEFDDGRAIQVSV
jgi:hypothetical protein